MIAALLGRDATLLSSILPVIAVLVIAVIAAIVALVTSARGIKVARQTQPVHNSRTNANR